MTPLIIKLNNLNRLVVGQLNINSIRNKFEALQGLIKGNLDIFVLTESKIDASFPSLQFAMDGYTMFRADRNANGGGVLIYIRDDSPCRQLISHPLDKSLEGICLQINLSKSKWLLFGGGGGGGGYNYEKSNIHAFLRGLGPIMDHYMCRQDNFLLTGDFNSETTETAMKDFCNTYNLKNVGTGPTCFKNPPCIHACIRAYIHECMNAFMYVYMHTCINAYMHTCRNAEMQKCTHGYMHTCMHAYMHTCIHT